MKREESDPVVAIDGPAGSGKSTTARALARCLGWTYLDTGAIYRTLGWLAVQEGVSLDDEDVLVALCPRLDALSFRWGEDGLLLVFLGDVDVTQAIRGEEAGRWASDVSRHPRVREALLDLQRSFAKRGPLVIEGRDTGTVVFPKARWKFYLTASLEERARRRLREMGLEETPENLEGVKEAIRERDLQDATRPVAPLMRAEDAVEVDTTDLSPEEVVNLIKRLVKEG
ncbi:MAG: (d)CMP kinase [Aquificota bacterium]|nr:MAG: (d)CMP kinase [Aquificota bacterium]